MNRIHHWICRSSFWRRALERKLIPWAVADAKLGDNVLEVGPGPGLTTQLLRARARRLTALEIDSGLAHALGVTHRGHNVAIVNGDATRMPFSDASFSSALSFTMLHHVPSPELQNTVFSEVFRILQPGGTFAGTDSRVSWLMKLIHVHDTLVPIDPNTLPARLQQAGFSHVEIETDRRAFRFRAKKPSS